MVMPNTTTATVRLAMDRHGSGASTSSSICVAIRSDASGGGAVAPGPAVLGGGPVVAVDDSGSVSVVSGSSGVTEAWSPVTKESGDAGSPPLGQQLGLLGLELLLGEYSLVLEFGQLAQLRRRVRARGAGGLAHVLVEVLLLERRLLGRPVVHRAAAEDQVQEDAEEGEDDDEDHPERLGPAAQVVAAEDVEEHHEREPDPDDEEKEVQDRQERI